MELNYFTSQYAIKIHDKIIDLSGGIKGIKTFDYIDSPLSHIQNDDYYPTIEDKLTHLVFSFNKFHAFNDGNKRTSIAMGAFFLEINGLDALVGKFIIEMENIAVLVADDLISKDLLNEILTSILNENEFEEELKLKIIASLGNLDDSEEGLTLGHEFYRDLF